MPIYEYYCAKCKEEYELKRSISQMDVAAPCPKCGSNGQRLASVFGATNEKYVHPARKATCRSVLGGK